jgi:hypothetical protein
VEEEGKKFGVYVAEHAHSTNFINIIIYPRGQPERVVIHGVNILKRILRLIRFETCCVDC